MERSLIKRQQKNALHFTRFGDTGCEFDPTATEVAILDGGGNPVWIQTSPENNAPIRWEGKDSNGSQLSSGDYICKIVYPDQRIAYLPFAVVKKD